MKGQHLDSHSKSASTGSRGVILNTDALDILNQALEKWWNSSLEKRASKTKKLTREMKAIGLGGLEVKTVDRIFRSQPVDEVSLRKAFESLTIQPAFSRERHCVPPSPPSGYLPHLPAHFIGREAEIDSIQTLLKSNRLVTLTGTGGIGKTWLAKQATQEIKSRFTSGIWFVDLAGLAADADQSLVEQKVATTLGVQEQKHRSLLETLSTFLRERELLLILDNCEHLLQACATLTDHLLSSSSTVRVLATSRERLNIPFERPYPVPSLAVPDLKQLSAASGDITAQVLAYDSVRLFVERAGNLRDFTITDVHAPLLAAICHRLDGIPLAIELAAARARSMPLSQLEEELDDCFRILIGGNRAALPRHQTLRATLDWSHNLLTVQEKALLRRLSVFAEGCSREAAEQVCAGEGIATRAVLELLTSLLDKSLLVYKEEAGKARYHLLETVRQYGQDWLTQTGERDAVRARHRDYFLQLAEQAEPELEGANQAEWLQRLETEHENFQAALEGGILAGDARTCLRLCGALSPFWWTRGYLSEGRQWCARTLDMAGSQERAYDRAKALNAAGLLAHYQSDYVFARSCHEEALGIWEELGERSGMAHSLLHLGQAAHYQSDFNIARSCYAASLTLWRELGDQGNTIRSLNSLGDVAAKQGDSVFARSCHEESLAICREMREPGNIARALLHLGHTLLSQWDFSGAISCYEQCLTICQETGDRRGILRALSGLGVAAQYQCDYSRAQSYFEKALALYREAGDRRSTANILNNIGSTLYAQRDYKSACSYYAESLTIYREIEDRQGIAYAHIGMVYLAHAQGDYPTALAHLEESLPLFREVGDQNGIAHALNLWGDVAYSQEDYTTAWQHITESLLLYRYGSRSDTANLLGTLANIAYKLCNPERAAVLWGASEALQEEIGWSPPPHQRAQYDISIAQVRQALDAEAFTIAWSAGQRMTKDGAIEYALEEPGSIGLPLHLRVNRRLMVG